MAKRDNSTNGSSTTADNVVPLPKRVDKGSPRRGEGLCEVLNFPTPPELLPFGSLDLMARSDGTVLVDACISWKLMLSLCELMHSGGALRSVVQTCPEFSGLACFELEILPSGVPGTIAAAKAAGVRVRAA